MQLRPGMRAGTVVVSRKKGSAWSVERELPLAEGRHVITAAISNRWLAVSTRSLSWDAHAVEIYELGSDAKHVATLPFVDSVDQLDITDTRLVTSGQRQHHVFSFDGTWEPAGQLPHTDSDRIAIGNLFWLGRPGVIEGYPD